MKVIWMPLAKEALKQTSKYICKEFGRETQKKFIQEVKMANYQIGLNPEIGKVEPLLEQLPDGFRSVVVAHLNKIVYRVVENNIEVFDFWNCRRNPDMLSKHIIDD